MSNEVYTPEVVAELVEAYKAAEDEAARDAVVEEYAKKLGVHKASVRAKLVFEKVYVAKARKPKGSVVTKAQLVEDIAKALGVPSEVVESLEKATKPTLKLVKEALTQ